MTVAVAARHLHGSEVRALRISHLILQTDEGLDSLIVGERLVQCRHQTGTVLGEVVLGQAVDQRRLELRRRRASDEFRVSCETLVLRARAGEGGVQDGRDALGR